MVVDTRPLITLSGQRIGWERAIYASPGARANRQRKKFYRSSNPR